MRSFPQLQRALRFRNCHRVLMIAVSLSLVTFSNAALAWDGAVPGIPGEIDVAAGGNYDFRVYFNPSAIMCGNGNGWAYLNAVDPNYNVYVAVIMNSKALGKTVTIYTNRDANGYCHIGYIAAQ